MNDRRPDRDADLLAGAFHDDWTGGPMAEFARRAAAHARRRRARRQLLVAASAAAAMAVASFLAAHRQASRTPTFARDPVAAKPAYEIISDEQLVATLKDRSLLIVKKPDGTNQITLLGSPDDAPLPSRTEE
jgi:hypothetical protein